MPGLPDRVIHNDAAGSNSIGAESPRDIQVQGKNGNISTVAGIRLKEGGTIKQLLEQLHPNLIGKEKELEHAVAQVIKYNQDYHRNHPELDDIGDGSQLKPGQTVLLPSISYRNERGQIARVEGPTGRLTEISYTAEGQVSSYKITAANGKIEEEARLVANGLWQIASRNGRSYNANSVQVDTNGNLITSDSDGNRLSHLTRGDDIAIVFDQGHPKQAQVSRNDQILLDYIYAYEGGKTQIFARYANGPDKVLLSEETTPEALEQLLEAEGKRVKMAQAQQRASFNFEQQDNSNTSQFDFSAGFETNKKIAEHARQVANSINKSGSCFQWVAKSLDAFGVHLKNGPDGSRAATVAAPQLAADPRFIEITGQVTESNLPVGAIGVRGKSDAHPYGHIFVYLGNGEEASDHVQQLTNASAWGPTRYFIMKDA